MCRFSLSRDTKLTAERRFKACGYVQFDASRRGKKINAVCIYPSSLVIQMKARTEVGRGDKSLRSDPGSESRLGREKEKEREAL